MAAAAAPLPAAVADWWERVNGSPAWQDGIFYALAVLYGVIAAASFVSVTSPSVNAALYGRH